MKKGKQNYKAKGQITHLESLKEKKTENRKQSGLKIQPNEEIKKPAEISLTVDLGSLSPMFNEFISSPEQFSPTPSSTSPTHYDIVNDSIGCKLQFHDYTIKS